MSYLDVSPVISALGASPAEFEMCSGSLHHVRSSHSFTFDEHDHVRINAECCCSLLAVRPEQERAFAARFREWHREYWRPIEINREFADHFWPRPRILRMMIGLTGGLHRWLLSRGRGRHTGAQSVVPSVLT